MNFRKVLALFLLTPAFLAPGAGAVGVSIEPRYDHTTTLLPDGNILITGGISNTATVTNSVEMYDMASNTYISWSSGLGVGMERSTHTATLMSDGRVLIAGGFGTTGQPLKTLVICDPKSSSCGQAGVSMITARGGHTATLLSKGPRAGQVLLCGGHTTGTPENSTTATCETYDPATNTRSDANAMVSPREEQAAVLMRSGKVFITGGRRQLADSTWSYEPMNELYDPSLNIWTPVSALLQGRINHTATVLNNGNIMIAGGYNAVTTLYCRADADSIKDECWNIKNDPYNTIFNAGSHGYIDGAEFFDQNGARVVLAEQSYGVMPYRVDEHSAALKPDGRWETHGGYGNIVPTFFGSTLLANDSVLHLTPTGNLTADIIGGTTKISLPLKFKLSRPVSGRLVDADAYISRVANSSDPSFTIDTAKFYLDPSRAPADGAPVGMLLGDKYEPGDFDSTLQLASPAGNAAFTTQYQTSGMVPDTTSIVSSALTMSGPLFPTISNKTITGSVNAQVRITAPNVFRGITGLASVIDGQVAGDHYVDINGVDKENVYSITFKQAGSQTFDILNPASCETVTNTCVFTANINFTGMSGKITNLTSLDAGTTVYTPLNAAGNLIQLSLKLQYVARQVSVLDRTVPYTFTQSTMIIRGMVFSNMLTYSPDTNAWGDMLADKKAFPPMLTPRFNHTAMLTPAADTVILGGRNCEFSPTTDCLRSAPRFSTATVTAIRFPAYRDSTGNTSWPAGQPLNSKRAFHTSTLLPNGHILTCGGSDGVIPLATCELMDPVTKAWTPTGSMNSPRANHTATLLPNGNVLVAGGTAPSGVAISSAEIYYPDTQRWVLTSSMTTSRQLHTATLLPDGNVLVAGGATLHTYTPTAEIYITSEAHWLSAGPMHNGRSQHTATLLKSGNVLMAGGVNDLGTMNQSEVFLYLTKTFIPGPNLKAARYAHTANQLRDGKVIVIGGSDGSDSLPNCEIYNGASWTPTTSLNYARANHRSVLLPNGKIMLTGGEMSGVAQSIPESFDPDYRGWSTQGKAAGRTHHTSVLTKDNLLINIGGWSGGKYLDSTEYAHFSMSPDMNGVTAAVARQPAISTGTNSFDQAAYVTLLSGTSNFHGISEASGGGSGPMNSSYSNPRVYIQQIDNPSGFMIDLSTRIYSLYLGPNASWEATLSSITVIMPSLEGELPHGWYNMRVAANGQFSEGHTVQVTIPRPTGSISFSPAAVLGPTSVRWKWEKENNNDFLSADGYAVFSSSNDVFISTAALDAPATYIQTGLAPNTAAAIKVGGYNSGGYSSPLKESTTVYTLAVAPRSLKVDEASFQTAHLSWDPTGNSALTIYEVSMSKDGVKSSDGSFSSPLYPIPFSNRFTGTNATINNLTPNQSYYFHVRAKNGAGDGNGFDTGYSPTVSTITVGNINSLIGTPLTMSSIDWSWRPLEKISFYEAYDITAGTASPVFISSVNVNNYTQTNLSTNTVHQIAVRAVLKDTAGPVYGPFTASNLVYTLAVQPLPGIPSAITDPSTDSLTINWITNGNPPSTAYMVGLASDKNYTSIVTTHSLMGTSDSLTGGISDTFSGLTPNTSYYAGIIAVNGDGVQTTLLKLPDYGYTDAQTPTNFRFTSISMSGVNLAWDTGANPPNTNYEIRYSTYLNLTQSIKTYPSARFQDHYTTNTIFINGLMTETSYYFDVAAENNANTPVITGRTQCVPAVFTKAGPSGAPSGSLAGTSLPGSDVTIAGPLPNGRAVTLLIPAGSFAVPTAIAISSAGTDVCHQSIPMIGVGIYFENIGNAKLQVPATLNLSYTSAESNSFISSNLKNLVLARNTGTECLPLETQIAPCGAVPYDRCITAKLNQFSTVNLNSNFGIFQLIMNPVATTLDNARAYPNPFYTNRGNGFVTIDRLPASAKVRIYTLSGDKVWEGTATNTGVLTWNAVNKSGVLVGSGIYLAAIDSSAGKKVLKIAVER